MDVNAGIYVISEDAFNLVEKGTHLDMTSLFNKFISKKMVVSYSIKDYWIDIGRPEELLKANIDWDKNEVLSTILGVIPARSGSKRIKNKNILKVHGRPLIDWTIKASLKSRYLNRTIVSTDSEKIAKIATELGGECPFLRPIELASDDAKILDVIKYTVNKLPHYKYLILLQPTSPMRNEIDIDKCIELFFSSSHTKSVASVCEYDPIFQKPEDWNYVINSDGKLLHASCENLVSQGKKFTINGAIYMVEIEWLLRTNKFISEETFPFKMSKSRSLDIDTDDDLNSFYNILGKKK